MCRVLRVARSGFHAWQGRLETTTPRQHENALVGAMIEQCLEESSRTYGVPRIWRELRRQGMQVNHKRIRRIMRERHLSPVTVRKFRPRTTKPYEEKEVEQDRVHRGFCSQAPHRVFVSDTTCLPTERGWVYLVVFIDLSSRMVKGWHVSNRLTADLVTRGSDAVTGAHRLEDGAIFHSDRGSRYTSGPFRERPATLGAGQGMGVVVIATATAWRRASSPRSGKRRYDERCTATGTTMHRRTCVGSSRGSTIRGARTLVSGTSLRYSVKASQTHKV